jgi:hypothetical protein
MTLEQVIQENPSMAGQIAAFIAAQPPKIEFNSTTVKQ